MVKSTRTKYVPNRGELIWLTFSPKKGHEQAGRRPALVLSPALYNERTGLLVACPVTSKTKKYPYEVSLASDGLVTGAILSDHVRNVDWKQREAEYITEVSADVLEEVLTKLGTLLR